MGYIGQKPSSVALTSSDIGADIINADKIADDSISEEHIDNTAITGHSAITSLADTDKFLVSDASDSGNLKYVESQYIGGGLDNWSENSGNLLPSNASYGIYLGVNSATAANLLNDYEEGTFTPTLGGASSDPSSVSFNSRSGNYTKIGDRVFINVIVYLSAISGGGGNINIRGLPFTSNNRGTGSMIFDRMRIQASYQNEVTPYVENNSTYVAIGEMNDAIDEGRSHVQIDDLASNAYIMFSAQYTTDS